MAKCLTCDNVCGRIGLRQGAVLEAVALRYYTSRLISVSQLAPYRGTFANLTIVSWVGKKKRKL